MPTRLRCVLLAVAISSLFVTPVAAQTTGDKPSPAIVKSMAGADLFNVYCAACHGRDGKGNGPVVGSLNSTPPDLTALARQNGGLYPRGRVKVAIAAGKATPAHGSADMPVWGPIFRVLDPSDRRTEIRINNLVAHLASIQEK